MLIFFKIAVQQNCLLFKILYKVNVSHYVSKYVLSLRLFTPKIVSSGSL